MARPTFARIDLDAVMSNVAAVKERVGGRPICAAVKADAYGHGAGAVAPAMCAAGVDMFGVAMVEEAAELRQAGIDKPIMLLTTAPDDEIDAILDYGVTACITDEEFGRRLAARAAVRGLVAEAHVNVDTGMRRVGIPHEHASAVTLRLTGLPGLRITGMFSHFACSTDPDLSFSRTQIQRFRQVVGRLDAAGCRPPFLHMANSGAVLSMPESYWDGVRPGLILYGLRPLSGRGAESLALRPALSFHTRIAFCKDVPAGESLGYGRMFTTWRRSVIATLPVGYHDGFLRSYTNKGRVLVRGHYANVVGRVCMDQTLVDVTDVPGVEVGDDVVIYGEQGGRSVGIEEMAALVDRVPYELTCSVGGRVRRQYVIDGAVAGETPMRSLVPDSLVCRLFPGRRPGYAGPGAAPDARQGAA